MDQTGQLREMVATMLGVLPEQVKSDTSLTSLHASLGDARLRLGLKRLDLPPLTSGNRPATFGALEAIITGRDPNQKSDATNEITSKQGEVSVNTATSDLRVGIDAQEIDSLPVADDYWVHEFYAGTFDRSEIAYAVAQSEPRIHLAGCWCAKEALRKCDGSFLKIGFERIAVAHESGGRPYLFQQTSSGPVRLPHALSISHTKEIATAVVVSVPAAEPRESSENPISRPDEAKAAHVPPRNFGKSHSLQAIVFRSLTLIAIGALVALLSLHFLAR